MPIAHGLAFVAAGSLLLTAGVWALLARRAA
jgi:hypothetical protein